MEHEHNCLRTEEFKELRKDIDKLYDKSDEIIRLSTIVNQNTESLKEASKTLTEVSKTMIKMSENLSNQHETLKEMNVRLNKTNEKVDELDKKVADRGSINVIDESKKVWPWFLVVGILYALTQVPTILQSLF